MSRPTGARLTTEQHAALEALILSGVVPAEAARRLGVGARSAWRIAKRLKAGTAAASVAAPIPPGTARREIRDSSFWRQRAARLERELADAEHLAEQLAGVRGQDIVPPSWLLPPKDGRRNRAVLGLLLSDLHVGEVVDPDEISGLNAYGPDIFRARIRRYFAAAIGIGPRWAADCRLEGALVVLGGDLISGDIHEELRITNALTAHEQVRLAVEEIAAGLRQVVETFGRVHVVSVPGNHGRTTQKPTAKLYSRLSYDTLAATMLHDLFTDDGRVTFQIATGRDAIVPVVGWTIFVNHGDGMGTGGGQGFIGPLAPIVRGSKKVENQQFRAKRPFDLLLHGHYHTSANPGPVLSNGSMPGYTEYGNGLRAAIEPAQQWLFLMHERWGLRERAEIKLEEPTPPPLPRVRIPAAIGDGGSA